MLAGSVNQQQLNSRHAIQIMLIDGNSTASTQAEALIVSTACSVLLAKPFVTVSSQGMRGHKAGRGWGMGKHSTGM